MREADLTQMAEYYGLTLSDEAKENLYGRRRNAVA